MAEAEAVAGQAAEAHGPMHQFEIKRLIPMELFGYDVSFTNASLFMVLALVLASLFLITAMSRRSLVPGRLQSVVEMHYEFVARILRDATGKEGMRFFPFVFTIFMFILTGNMLGMIPGAFTFTSHIIVTFAHGDRRLVWRDHHRLLVSRRAFPPASSCRTARRRRCCRCWCRSSSCPTASGPISLSVRLFGNMMAGHTMLKVFAGFIVSLGAYYLVPGIAPLAITVVLTASSSLVAFLQAYIFTVLTCIYLNDAIHMH